MRWPLVSFIPRLFFIVCSWLSFFPWSVVLYNQSQLYFPIVCFPVSSSSTCRFLGYRHQFVYACNTQHPPENPAESRCFVKVYRMETSELWEDLWFILNALMLNHEGEVLSSPRKSQRVFSSLWVAHHSHCFAKWLKCSHYTYEPKTSRGFIL